MLPYYSIRFSTYFDLIFFILYVNLSIYTMLHQKKKKKHTNLRQFFT